MLRVVAASLREGMTCKLLRLLLPIVGQHRARRRNYDLGLVRIGGFRSFSLWMPFKSRMEIVGSPCSG